MANKYKAFVNAYSPDYGSGGGNGHVYTVKAEPPPRSEDDLAFGDAELAKLAAQLETVVPEPYDQAKAARILKKAGINLPLGAEAGPQEGLLPWPFLAAGTCMILSIAFGVQSRIVGVRSWEVMSAVLVLLVATVMIVLAHPVRTSRVASGGGHSWWKCFKSFGKAGHVGLGFAYALLSSLESWS